MPIRLHKKEEAAPGPAAERPRVTKTHGFPKFVLALAIVVLAVLAVFFWFRWTRIQTRGRVVAAFAEYAAEGPCRVTKVDVQMGKPVSAGDVLVVTEAMDYKSQVPQYEAALDQAKARLTMAEKGGDVGVVDLSVRPRRLTDAREAADVAKARLTAAEKSEKEYSDLVTAIEADRKKEVTKAQADLATGTEKLKQAEAAQTETAVTRAGAKLNWDRAERLKKDDAITVSDYELARMKYDFATATAAKAASAVTEAQASLAGIEKVLDVVGKKLEAELEAQKARLERAKAETEVARAFVKGAETNLAQAEGEMKGVTTDAAGMESAEKDFLKKQVVEAQGRLDYFKAMAGTVEFKAPFTGTVCELNKAVNDSADRFERIVAIYDPATVAVEVYVPEDDLDRVRAGQKAHVAVRGTKIRFEGSVVAVNTSPARLPGEMKATPAPEFAFDRFVTCRISVPETYRSSITPAMRANVTIYTW